MDYPYVLGGLSMLVGYLKSFIQQSPQYNDENFKLFLMSWQKKRLSQIMRTKCFHKI
jgi:hypothetical protein